MKWFGCLISVGVVAILVALMFPVRHVARDASPRSQSRYNAKQFGIAFHNHHEDVGHFPSGTLRDADGNAVHGWMTALLPHIERGSLFESIDLARPWDDDVNAEAMRTEIGAYRNVAIDTTLDDQGFALAHYAANSFAISAHDPMRFAEFEDGHANTFLAGEVNGDFVAWGYPLNFRDPTLGINAVPHGFGAPWKGGGANMLLGDGHVRWFSDNTDPAVLRAGDAEWR